MIQKGQHFWEWFKKNQLARNLSSLLSGNIVAVLIPVLISPILTRLFTEADFGLLTVFNSILAISLSFSTGRLDFAILEAKNKSISSHLFAVSVLIAIVVSVFAAFLGVFLFSYVNGVERLVLTTLVIVIPIMILISALSQSLRYVLNREDGYKELSVIKIIRSISTGGVQLSGGYLNPGSLTLVFGKVFGDIIALVLSIWIILKNKLISFKYSRLRFGYVLTKFSKYYRINTFHALFNTVSANVLPILFATLFTIQEAGYYGLSYRVCIFPITIISQAIFQLYSREFAKRLDEASSTYNFFKKILRGLLAISIIPFLILIGYGPELFGLVFGENWTESGVYAQILAPYMLMVFLVSPFTFVPIKLEKHVKSFIIEIINSVSRLMALFIGSQFNVETALIFYSAFGFITQLYLLIWITGLMRVTEKKVRS